jgi:hypothetical protein
MKWPARDEHIPFPPSASVAQGRQITRHHSDDQHFSHRREHDAELIGRKLWQVQPVHHAVMIAASAPPREARIPQNGPKVWKLSSPLSGEVFSYIAQGTKQFLYFVESLKLEYTIPQKGSTM